jgi:ubiquinone/menaquinone biosynthesis C-methylase UbiE
MRYEPQMSDQTAEERFHFNSIATLYDSARPGYPALLIDDIIFLSKISPESSVLDIGCGTGKSAEPFAKRGYNVCALDPGAHMLEQCKRNLHGYPNVSFEMGSFETWTWSGQPFDLVISGTAFHWVPETARQKLTAILKPSGALGIFWHTFLNGPDPIYGKIDELYKRYAPENCVADFDATQEVFDRKREKQMLSMAGFGPWRVIRYYTDVEYDAKGYVDLMRTWSTHRNTNGMLFTEVGSAIKAAGGRIAKPIRTHTLSIKAKPRVIRSHA